MLKRTVFTIAIIVSYLVSVQAQDLNEKLSIDPLIKYGKLENGFTYYIRHNEEPKNRLELRLAINAGSICEDDDQQGLAHLLEHMCFNGTEHFEKDAIVNFIESTGVKFGQHLNAYTSFDETVYMLQMPTDRKGLIDTAFLILEDWAHNVTLADDEIDKERGVVKEEWRLGLGAQRRMSQIFLPILLKDSKYAERLPIGKMEVIDTCSYETIRRFYNDWYRPNLQAIIIVGDIDIDEMEKKVIDHFNKITNPNDERERVEFEIPNNKEPLIAIATDEEATYLMVNIFYKHEKQIKTTIGDYRTLLKEKLYNAMLNSRLAEITQKPTAPFMYAYTGYGGFLGRSKDAYSSFAMAKENQIEMALQVLLEENKRVENFGFTATEFERQKLDILRGYEKSYNERDKHKSRTFTSEYVSNFLSNEPIPGIEKEYELSQQLIPGITLDEINQLAKNWITDENMAILISAPKKEGILIPTKEDVLKVIDVSKSTELEAYEDKVNDAPLISDEITLGEITSIKKDEEGNYEIWSLSNGIELYIKPTDFKNDEILFTGYKSGGSSLLSDDEVVIEEVFSSVIDESGLGVFSGVDLEKKLTGKIVSLSPYLNDLKHGFNGSCSPQDIESLLQLQYLFITDPRKDNDVFAKVIDNQKNQMKFLLENPRVAFYESLYKVVTSNSPRTIVIPTEEQLNSIEQERIYEFYKELYQSPNGYKFFMVGNIDAVELKPLVEKYLAGIPSEGVETKWKDVSPIFPEGKIEFEVHKGKEPQSMVAIMMKGNYEYTPENNMIFKTLEKVLGIKLREQLREEESGTYGVSVRKSLDKFPKQEYSLSINFGCAPENVDKLVNVILAEIEKIQKDGPENNDLNKAKETFIRDRETNVKENKYWQKKLVNISFLGSNLISDKEYTEAVKAVTSKQVKKAANEYLTLDHYVLGVLKPFEEAKDE